MRAKVPWLEPFFITGIYTDTNSY